MSFSIFGKKKEDKKSSSSDQKSTQDNAASVTDSATTGTTESKMNVIESANVISRVLNNDEASNVVKQTRSAETAKTSAADIDYLLDANSDRLVHHVAAVEAISTLEEATILFAGKQIETAEFILQSLIQDEKATEPNTGAWLMLFDLYQATNNQPKFLQLRSEYATRWLEVTPPDWRVPQTHLAANEIKLLMPSVIEGDNQQLQQLISKISDFAAKHPSVQLDCSQLTRIDFTSCGQLLSGLIPIRTMPGVVSIEFHDVNHLVSALLNAMGFNSIATIFPRQH